MNARKEFLQDTLGFNIIACKISHNKIYHILKTEYTQEEYNSFLESLDFEYDNGFGTQYLFGTIWCEDNTWLSRHEYDGSEGWELHRYPIIDDDIRNRAREREKEINKILTD